jgi:AmmeMemoRadiSam system protein B
MIQGEHGVEMLLPGLSKVLAADGRLGTFLVGPIANQESLRHLALQVIDYIQCLKGGQVLLMISSDMTHYGPRFSYEPFGHLPKEETKKKISDLDHYFLDDVSAGDIKGIWELKDQQKLTICGFWPILLGMQIEKLLLRQPENSTLEYYTSMDVYPGRPQDTNAVAYGAFRRQSQLA